MPAELWTFGSDGFWRSEYSLPYSLRENLVYGTYRPDATTTGILSDRSGLTVINGNYTTVQASELIENKWIKGKVTIKHPGVRIKNCLITGDTAGPSSPSYSAITAYDRQTSPCVVTDCTIEASVTTVYSGNGVHGKDMELYRCNISGWVDGIGQFDRNCVAKGNWIHDLPRYAWSPNHGDGSHNDGIQVHGGSTFTIVGNSIETGQLGTSAVIVTQDVAATSAVLIDRNWFISVWPTQADATGTGLNITNTGSGGGGAAMSDITITDNEFSAFGLWKSNHAGLIDATTFDIATITGNVNVGTATAAKITRA